jgi:hypothetical protein
VASAFTPRNNAENAVMPWKYASAGDECATGAVSRDRQLHQRSDFKLFGNHPSRQAADAQAVAHRVLDGFRVAQLHPR